ncbi:MAG: sulfurtransferase TusA family protein [Methylocystaceae bacterium]|nr:sulfurtransferase TusA family protein [Methylocystaceae bacterium]
MNNQSSNKSKFISDFFIDITTDTCPMTFVKTKIQLEKMQSGQILEVLLNHGEPLKNVPLSAVELGHIILDQYAQEDGKTYRLFIRCA